MTTVTEPTAKRYSAGAAYDLGQVEDSQRTQARKVERTWRGEVTPERVEADHAEALDLDVAAAARKAAVRAVVARKATEVQVTEIKVEAKPVPTVKPPMSAHDFHQWLAHVEALGMPAPTHIDMDHGIWLRFETADDMAQWATLMQAKVYPVHAGAGERQTVDAYHMRWNGHFVNLRAPMPPLPVREPGAAMAAPIGEIWGQL